MKQLTCWLTGRVQGRIVYQGTCPVTSFPSQALSSTVPPLPPQSPYSLNIQMNGTVNRDCQSCLSDEASVFCDSLLTFMGRASHRRPT